MTGSDAAGTIVADALREALAGDTSTVSVAVSGGRDSTVLLHALAGLRDELALDGLRVLHVHHGLLPQADDWARAVADQARGLGVACLCLRVHVEERGDGREAAARRARYTALGAELRPGERLCVAHSADDQAETVLLQLMRGGGERALSAMPASRRLGQGLLLRPLLRVSREVIADYADRHRLPFVEDPDNASPHRFRAGVRHELLPLMRRLRPGVERVLCDLAARQWETAEAVQVLADEDVVRCGGRSSHALSRRALGGLSPSRVRAALHRWLSGQGLEPPPGSRLIELARQVLEARCDRQLHCAWGEVEVRSHGDELVALHAPAMAIPPAQWRWEVPQPLHLPHGVLRARLDRHGGLRQGLALQVRVGERGVRCRPAGRAHHAPLKELLRRQGVPPWERTAIPLIYDGERLVAVAGLLVCEGYQSAPGDPGWRVCWTPGASEASG